METNKVETRFEGATVIYKRYFDAPVELVFEAWSSHEHLSNWWGPDGFTLTTKHMDFSDGGVWEFIMHGPDGTDYKNKIRFIEINKPFFMSYKHVGDGEGETDVKFTTKITFEKSGEGTNMTMEQEFPSTEEMERVDKKYNAIEGGRQHVANLAKYLAEITQR